MENNKIANGSLLKTKSEFDISESALACIVFIVFNILTLIILTIFGVNLKLLSDFAYYTVHAVVEALFALAALVVAKAKKKNLIEAAGMKMKVNGAIVGWSFLLALVSLFGFANLTNVFLAILEKFGLSDDNLYFRTIDTFWRYLGAIISSCLFAGFAEELLFRGVIESGFKKWGMKVAVGFSALIFMIMHGSVMQTVHQLIIGIIIGYVFYKTNNLWIGIIIHCFNNFIPITETFLLSVVSDPSTVAEVPAEAVTPAGVGSILIDLIIALVVAWAGYYFVSLILKKIFAENEKLNGKKGENETVASITVDGQEQEIEMSIDGVPAENVKEEKIKEERPKISGVTIAMFSIAGFYLILEWILGTISLFM